MQKSPTAIEVLWLDFLNVAPMLLPALVIAVMIWAHGAWPAPH